MSTNENELPANPLEQLNFTRADYFIQFFIVSPLPLIFLFSLYQSVDAGARQLYDLSTIGLGLYFALNWLLYPLSYLAIQFMAARRINLRRAADKASSRISLKYLSVLGGYFLAIPLSFMGFTVFSSIKKYQALKKGCPSCVSSPAAADAMAAERAQAMREELEERQDQQDPAAASAAAADETRGTDETRAAADTAAAAPADTIAADECQTKVAPDESAAAAGDKDHGRPQA